MPNKTNKRPTAWLPDEDRAVVLDYLRLLTDQKAGRAINKSKTRRALLPLLVNRSEGSIEFKRCNISAVLVSLGLPYLQGYRPRDNYQRSLVDVVKNALPAFGIELLEVTK